MIQILDENGNIIHTSNNLRGIRDHNRRSCVELCDIKEINCGKAIVIIFWTNGDNCILEFASFHVAKLWAMKNHGIKASENIRIEAIND